MPTKAAASKAPQAGSKELAGIAKTGDRLATLEALRDRLAEKLDNYQEPRDMAMLVLRLTDVLEQIDSMPTSRQVSAADEIAERRAARRVGRAQDSARPARSS